MSLYELSDEEASIAFEAIERRRIAGLCECEPDVGYACKRCRRIANSVRRGGDDVTWDTINSDMAWHKSRQAMRRRIWNAEGGAK